MKRVLSHLTLRLLAAALTLAAAAGPALGYEPATTHPGLTAKAALSSRLHRFLRREWGLRLGLFATLRLDATKMDRRRHAIVTRHMQRLDPAGGYRADKKGRLGAVGWLLAGSVLADVPGTHNRHHYYSPVLKRGLDNRRPLLSGWHSLLAALESGDNVRQLLTGAGFDLSGRSALDWIKHPHNPLRVQRFHSELRASLSSTSAAERRHHLARALLALGSVLSVLQDMAVPGHVRDDFLGDATQRLGTTGLDRGSGYERYVAAAYGLVGIPDYRGKPVRFDRLRDYFSNKRWTGLADRTAVAHFSLGTLPRTRTVATNVDRGSLQRALARSLRFSQPRVPAISIACASHGTCQAKGKRGVMFAYRLDRKRRLTFFLDGNSYAATARHLLPLAIGYTRGAIDFLLRGRLALRRKGQSLVIGNSGVALDKAKLSLYVDDDKGQRRLLRQIDGKLPAARGALLATINFAPPKNARRLIVVADARDRNGQPLVAAATLSLEKKSNKPRPGKGDPLWKEDKPAKPIKPASQPASGPSSAPASQTTSKPTSKPTGDDASKPVSKPDGAATSKPSRAATSKPSGAAASQPSKPSPKK